MKYLLSGFVTAMGFLLGMVLAGVGGLSAKTAIMSKSDSEGSKKIENYWHETGIDLHEVGQLVSNEKCYSSEIYYRACLNSVVDNSIRFNLKLSTLKGTFEKLSINERLDEKTEKERLSFFSQKNGVIDFSKLLNQLMLSEVPSRRATLASELINSFLSVYFDPHTYIMPGNFYDEVGSKLARSKYFVGIAYEKLKGEFFIRKVAKNSDADRAGLKVNDKIIAINSLILYNSSYRDFSSLLRNEELTDFKFVVVRNHAIYQIGLKRSYRELSHVQYNELVADKAYGLITLSKFNSGVCEALAAELKAAEKNRVPGLILDLRDNPGGQLNEAACVAGLFLGKHKKAYYVEYFDPQKANEVVLTSEPKAYSGPVVVLVNSASASAAELLAGGLQEHKRAIVIGEVTFGKGTFQESEEWVLNPKISLYKTQGLYLLPSRNSTQFSGITPNVELHAEKSPVKREKTAFFNPIKYKKVNYGSLKDSDVVSGYVYVRCKDSAVIYSEDVYLNESIQYLSCSRVNGRLIYGDAGKTSTWGF